MHWMEDSSYREVWGRRLARLWLEGLFLLPVFLIPLLFSWNPDFANTNTIVIKETVLQWSTVNLILFIPLLIWVDYPSQWRVLLSSLPWRMLALVFALIGYLYFTHTWTQGNARSYHEWMRWLTYLLFTGAAIPYAANARRFRLFLYTTMAASLVVSGYAVSQALGYDFFTWETFAFEQNVRRVCSTMGNPDFLAGYLAAILPVTFSLVLTQRGRSRLWLGGLFVLQVLALILSYSRGGWIAVFVSFILFFSLLTYINWIREPVLFKPVISLRTAIGSLAIVMAFGFILTVTLWHEISAAVYRFTQLGEGHSVTTRTYFYQGAWDMWRARPFTGHGIGMFGIHFPDFRALKLSLQLPFFEWNLDHAHNEFLEILSETGLIGLLLYLGVIGIGWHWIWRGLRKNRTRANVVLIGLLCGIAGTLIHNLFTVTLRHTPSAFLLWSFLGVGVGYARSQVHIKEISLLRGAGVPAFALALLAFVPALYSFTFRNYVGDTAIVRGCNTIKEIDVEKGIRFYQEKTEQILVLLHKGKRLAPDLYESYNWLGVAYDWFGDYPQQHDNYLEQYKLNPTFTTLKLNLCVSYMKQADQLNKVVFQGGMQKIFPDLTRQNLTEALKWIEQAIENDPYAPEYYHKQGRCYLALGELDKARTAFQKMLDIQEEYKLRPLEKIHNEMQESWEYVQAINDKIGEPTEVVMERNREQP